MSLRIGILGAARVATYAMIDAAHEVEGVIVAGVAARDLERARTYAQTHRIDEVFGSYEALIASPEIDAVYVALPPNAHAQWSIAVLEAGKPVLCEKPFALSVGDVEAMLEAETRTGKLLMEAQHSHYHPLSARMREVAASGVLGRLARIEARFDAPVGKEPGEIRYDPALGGGALWDLGVYPAYWIRSVLGEEPEVLSAIQTLAPLGADTVTKARLASANCPEIYLSCNMDAPPESMLRIEGSAGSLDVHNPLAPQMGHGFRLTINGVPGEEQFPKKSTYAFQLEAFRDAALNGTSVPTRGEDSLATIRLLSDIRDAARKE
jgi:predicted dehydrogenase